MKHLVYHESSVVLVFPKGLFWLLVGVEIFAGAVYLLIHFVPTP